MAKIVAGSTSSAAANWQPHNNQKTAVYVDVDTSLAKFSKTPLYFTSTWDDRSLRDLRT